MSRLHESDTLVIGGGVVGMALAYGLARAGERVQLLDEGDDAYRAARGNFGLVWVQGKGLGRPAYARWTLGAAAAWPAFAAELAERTGVDVELSQIGGLTMCLGEEELAARADQLRRLREELGVAYPFEVLDPGRLRQLIPQTGPAVAGAVMCPLDGHTSPLRLLRALVQAYEDLGGRLTAGARVEALEFRERGFEVHAGEKVYSAAKLVLAAGLGNRELAPRVGLSAPVQPNRGQILVTERLQPFLKHPTLYVRQTGEGVVQIGDSKEDVGLDDSTTLAQLSRIADRAAKCFPLLAAVNIVRTWGALRVMSPDGFPIYQASASCPGAFVVTCHSGITLAPQHAGALVDWIRGGDEPVEIRGFKAERFDVQTH
ncbi:MAG: FAD-binding oxidoreductase [Rubrivivax sp.]|nr:FAD-binding oxidoreductase [Rubrivivax sp.]